MAVIFNDDRSIPATIGFTLFAVNTNVDLTPTSDMFQTFSFVFLLSALLSVINYKWLKLPSTIGTMILALMFALFVIASESLLPSFHSFVCDMIHQADFKTLLLDMMLSMLLFAGSIHIDLSQLKRERWEILLFASLGVLISTIVVGSILYLVAPVMGFELPFLHALLFGALISPTDPIAVIAILKEANVSSSLELKIEGESLFNDGVGVVVFTSVLLLATGSGAEDQGSLGSAIGHIFLTEAVMGIVFGFLLGKSALWLMRWVQEEGHLVALISLATVLGGYAIALEIETSGPLAMVVAGLIIGNGINHADFDEKSKSLLNGTWSVLDESLNAVLFVLIGLSMHLIEADLKLVGLATVAVFIVLIGRAAAVLLPFSLLKHEKHAYWPTSAVLIWGGLRGGISVALALSLSDELHGKEIFVMTFVVVVFSIIVQGLSLGKVVSRFLR